MDVQKPKRREPLNRREQIEILLEEYRSLNSLLLFRLAAMDRRLPVSVGIIAAAIASMFAVSSDSQAALLLAIPPALFWLVRSTVQHAKAKEDHLSRIAEIERTINSMAGEELLIFQSRHPNRSRVASGRTGNTTVVAVCSGALAMLLLCVFLYLRTANIVPDWLYVTYIAAIAFDVVSAPFALSRYRYSRPTSALPQNENDNANP